MVMQLSVIASIIVSAYVGPLDDTFIFLTLGLIWVPQIISNLVNNPAVKPFSNSAYPVLLTAHILYIPMYFKACDKNFLNL